MDIRQAPTTRRYIYVGIAFLIVLLAIAFHFREFQLAYYLYRHEGGRTAFTSKPLTAHLVGTAINAPLPSELFVTTDSTGVETATTVHRNGCFVLVAAKPQASFSSYAPGYMRVLTNVEPGYFSVQLKVSPVDSGKPGSVTLTRISAWDFIRRTVECTSSPQIGAVQ
jgi:hypothetical protein